MWRNTELMMMVFAIAISVFAYASVGLAMDGKLPSGMFGYGAGLVLLGGVALLVVRKAEAGELHLDYVIALEALLISPNDKENEGIANNFRSRAAALFLTPAEQDKTEALVRRAYKARSTYVHGDVIKDQTEQEKLKELRALRHLTL